MEDIAEQRDLSDEISAAIRGLGVQSDVDDDELLKELDEMYEVKIPIFCLGYFAYQQN